MNKILVLTFNTTENKNYRLTIKNPKDDLTKETINNVAERIIATNIFSNSKRTISDFKKAIYVTRQETVIE